MSNNNNNKKNNNNNNNNNNTKSVEVGKYHDLEVVGFLFYLKNYSLMIEIEGNDSTNLSKTQIKIVSIEKLKEIIKNYENKYGEKNSQSGGRKNPKTPKKTKKKSKSKKIYTGKRGGRYYMKKGVKIYI